MKALETPLAGLLEVIPDVFKDDRGWFFESWNVEKFRALGITTEFAQDNHSQSVQGTLRGLHFQRPPGGQAKLVRCTLGRIWDVAVDIRPESPTLGKWHAVELDSTRNNMLFIPVGFAHGFCVLSDVAEVQYKCSTVYDPATEAGIAWDDTQIGVAWPIPAPLLSKRDQGNGGLRDYLASI